MTVETTAISASIEVFEIEMDIKNNHEAQELVTKIQKRGFLKEERYTWGTDEWNRPKRIKGKFMVLVKKENQRAFKIMVSQTENQTASKISLQQLTNFI